VQYFEKALHCKWKLENFPNIAVKIMKIKLITIPNFNLFGGCGKNIIWFLDFCGFENRKYIFLLFFSQNNRTLLYDHIQWHPKYSIARLEEARGRKNNILIS